MPKLSPISQLIVVMRLSLLVVTVSLARTTSRRCRRTPPDQPSRVAGDGKICPMGMHDSRPLEFPRAMLAQSTAAQRGRRAVERPSEAQLFAISEYVI